MSLVFIYFFVYQKNMIGNTLLLVKKLCCQTHAAQDETRHIIKCSHYFTDVVGCKYHVEEWNVNEPLKLSLFWQGLCLLSPRTVQMCHIFSRSSLLCVISQQ